MSFLGGIGDFFKGGSVFKSLGGLGGTASLAAAGIGAAASLYGGFAAAQQAKKQAKLTQEQAASDAKRKRLETRRLMGTQRANYAAAGIKIDGGTPALLIDETEELGLQEADDILRFGGMQVDAYKSQGRAAMIGGGLSAAGGLLGGYAQNRLLKQQYPEMYRGG